MMPKTLTTRAYEKIEELIVTLALAPGTTVSEVDLSERLRIGRTPVREALQRLAIAPPRNPPGGRAPDCLLCGPQVNRGTTQSVQHVVAGVFVYR